MDGANQGELGPPLSINTVSFRHTQKPMWCVNSISSDSQIILGFVKLTEKQRQSCQVDACLFTCISLQGSFEKFPALS